MSWSQAHLFQLIVLRFGSKSWVLTKTINILFIFKTRCGFCWSNGGRKKNILLIFKLLLLLLFLEHKMTDPNWQGCVGHPLKWSTPMSLISPRTFSRYHRVPAKDYTTEPSLMLSALVILVVYHSFTCSKKFVAKQILKLWNQDSAHAFPEHESNEGTYCCWLHCSSCAPSLHHGPSQGGVMQNPAGWSSYCTNY
jgi:hypothetical protein